MIITRTPAKTSRVKLSQEGKSVEGKLRAAGKKRQVPLSKIVTVPPRAHRSTNIEFDNITLLNSYIPSASTLEIVERLSSGLRGTKNSRMFSITGPYGSGKSAMATFLSGLLAPRGSVEYKSAYTILKKEPSRYGDALIQAREKAGIDQRGMIRCTVMARREPLSATLLRALDAGLEDYFGKYTNKDISCAGMVRKYNKDLKRGKLQDTTTLIQIIEDVAKTVPVIIIVDEFGKSIEYFATDGSQSGDLFLLQELAERSGRRNNFSLFIMTLQHMAFEEHAAGASFTQKKEWAKIQGRFEDITFANSPDQTRILVSNTIQPAGGTEHARDVRRWAEKESRIMEDLGISMGSDPNLVASCYPLSPLALEILPELCSRYGQHERTLLSFLSDSKRNTVTTFIDENVWDGESPPVVGLDVLYDYFISGTGMIYSSSANVSRLMEIETIIRDAHGLSDVERKTLKAIGLLNLVGRSGYLRASKRLIEYSIKQNPHRILENLEKRSMITYRRHADEYRIWHGTDVDMAAKLEVYRGRYRRTSLSALLEGSIRLEPVVAAKHSIETGTMRIFERRFAKPTDTQDQRYDGTILYVTGDYDVSSFDKPVVNVTTGDTTKLKNAAMDVSAIRDILDSDDAVVSDWVARREFEERLADAEAVLDQEFASAYADNATWSYNQNGKSIKIHDKPSMAASKVCDYAYTDTPIIRNEMINRNLLSAQGSTAKKRLLEAMLMHPDKPRLGIEGHGPERAIYEAVLYENQIHVQSKSKGWQLQDPKGNGMSRVWNSMLDAIKKESGRKILADVYKVARMPPYGVRDGPVQLLMVAMMLIHRDVIALYEHGTFVPKLRPEVTERMTKNPEHFELKYFNKTPSKAALLKHVSTSLKTDSDLLATVSYLVRTMSSLPPYVKHTKNLDKKTMAVRDAVLNAREPDTLLFESLPKALGFATVAGPDDARKFAKALTKSMNKLQGMFARVLKDTAELLFDATGIDERAKLSEVAKAMAPSVSDQEMKVFLGALSADMLDDDEWIKYVAMSLTDTPPDNWKDEHKLMLENSLRTVSYKLNRLAKMYFDAVSGNFEKPSYQVTVTGTDGSEYYNMVSLNRAQKDRLKAIITLVKKEIKKNNLTKKDLGALVAMLGLESEQ